MTLGNKRFTVNLTPSIAAKLSPEDPEIAFNLAAVLEASQYYFGA